MGCEWHDMFFFSFDLFFNNIINFQTEICLQVLFLCFFLIYSIYNIKIRELLLFGILLRRKREMKRVPFNEIGFVPSTNGGHNVYNGS